MVENPALAPRNAKCVVCTSVAVARDVTIRMYGPDGERLPATGAIDYLIECGLEPDRKRLGKAVTAHRRHIDAWLERGGAVAPAQIAEGVTRIERPLPTGWVDANQTGINLGMAAMERIAGRMDGMKDKDLISVARMGQSAAVSRASLELKGAIKREEARAAIASGFEQVE